MKTKDIELETSNINLIELEQLKRSLYTGKIKIENFIKRTFDIVGSIFGIFALIPLSIGIYIANLIVGDRGPLFYSQKRIGKNGKLFKMYKW